MYALSGIEALTEAAAQAREVRPLHSRLEGELEGKIKSEMDARPTFQAILRAVYAKREPAEATTNDKPRQPTGKSKRPKIRPSVDDSFFLRVTHPDNYGGGDAAERIAYAEAMAEGDRPLAASVLARATGAHLLGATHSDEPPSTARLELELYKMYAALSNVDRRFMTTAEVTSWHASMQQYIPTIVRAQEVGIIVDKVYTNYLGAPVEGKVIVAPTVHRAITRLQEVRKKLSDRLLSYADHLPCDELQLQRFDEAMEGFILSELDNMVETRYRRGENDVDAALVADRLTVMLELVLPRPPESRDIFATGPRSNSAARSLGAAALRNLFGER